MNLDWVDQIKTRIPEHSSDIAANLDAVFKRTTLDPEEAILCALSAAVITQNDHLVDLLITILEQQSIDYQVALTAASITAQNNTWEAYINAVEDLDMKGTTSGLRMNTIFTYSGITLTRFELVSLSASIVSSSVKQINMHYNFLKKEGYTQYQLRDIGRIAAIMRGLSVIIVN
jgi:alkylhydroperoxidase/carboxymuconolactone decarboxylase family protein YurZ